MTPLATIASSAAAPAAIASTQSDEPPIFS